MGRAQAGKYRVAVSAYACGPGDEPEANAGYAFALAAAETCDVTVYTRERFRPQLERAMSRLPEAVRPQVRYHELPVWLRRLKRGPGSVYWYYGLWQRTLRERIRQDHHAARFDLLHHVTFANDWLPCAGSHLEIPLVWGPVGGASTVPVGRLARYLGLRGVATEVLRGVLTGAARRMFGDSTARRAALTVAQNPDVARRFGGLSRTVVEPNAALDDLPARLPRPPHTPPRAVFIGRLIAWKGADIALRALTSPVCSEWQLDIFGSGYQESRLRSRAAALGLGERVRFRGHRPRAEVLESLRSADAMIFPSMHDQAGWVAAEASSIGCPVICLPLGGPPVMAERNARVASLTGDIPTNVAEQLAASLSHPGTPHTRWSSSRLAGLVSEWYRQALTTDRAEGERVPR